MISLYPRSSHSETATPTPRLTGRAGAALEQGSIIGFKGVQAGAEQLASGNDNDVEPTGDLVPTEDLSNQSFRSISLHGAAEFPRRRNPQPAYAERIGEDEYRGIPALDFSAPFVHLLEVAPATDVFVGTERQHARGWLIRC